MRLRPLFYIVLIVALGTFVVTGSHAGNVTLDDDDDGGGLSDPGCGGSGEPACGDDGDYTGSGGGRDQEEGDLCIYSSTLTEPRPATYMECLLSNLPSEFQNDYTQISPFATGIPTINIFDSNGDEPYDLCYWEHSAAISSTTVTLNVSWGRGKIGKFIEPPEGDGQIKITVNTREYIYDTADAADLEDLNSNIFDLISEHFVVEDAGDYWHIIEGTPLAFPITKVGVKSTDSKMIISDIGIVPIWDLSGPSKCAPSQGGLQGGE